MQFSKEIRQIIKSAKITHFPIGLTEIQQIIKHFGWKLYSYKKTSDIIESYGLKEMTESNDSFAANIDDRIIIFYDDSIPRLDCTHILAHEIGHIVLGHLNDVDDIYTKERDCD